MLRLLAVSRSGLTVSEMLEILEGMGYQENVKVTMFDWLMFRLALAENVTESPYGVVNFSHQHLKEVVEYILLRKYLIGLSFISNFHITILKLNH